MESRDWHCEDPEKFFRGVTVRAAAQVCSYFGLSDHAKVSAERIGRNATERFSKERHDEN
jgi:hypothetical protein